MKTCKTAKIMLVLSVVLLVAFSGCTAKNEQTINTPNGDAKVSQGVVGPDWCKTGTSMTQGQQGQFSFIIKGLTTYKGQEVCEADATYDQGRHSANVTYYFSKDNKYMHMIMKDVSGNVINEQDINKSSKKMMGMT
jgi:hypothetical protein